MEKIKVNMSPNPLDVQTIHASQNDGEARQWEFELHNNGELIDTSEVTEQMFFKAYKGGTEQLLPENTSTPTTSPFLGDIKYPQGLLSDQEFTYRQSPTESDGLAKITDIKGNTLNWNQQHHEQSSTYWSASNASSSYADGVGTFTASSDGTFGQNLKSAYRYSVVGHKYLFIVTVKSSSGGDFNFGLRNAFVTEILSANIEKTVKSIQTATTANDNVILYRGNATSGDTLTIKNSMCFDLTQMGLDITDPSEFTSLFPLSYYSYNQGSLLSFMGNGIKTVGKNKFNLTRDINVTLSGVTFKSNADKSITVNGTATANATITGANGFTVPNIKKGESLIWSGGLNRPLSQAYLQLVYIGDETGQTYSFVSENNGSVSINATEDMTIDGVYISCRNGNRFNNETFYPMLRYANTDSIFEPYTSSTLSLPISTYFPSGMKSAGNVYDELTESKAVTRIGAVDLGSLEWTYASSVPRFYSYGIVNVAKPSTSNTTVANILCSKFTSTSLVGSNPSGTIFDGIGDKLIAISDGGAISIRDTSYTDATAFKTAMNGVILYYELATPTETSFTTASLVTENAEIPLSNEDGVLVGKCTEQLSENPGFIDAKIKLSDSDGTCYSNKLQLHVERSPQ